MTRVLLIAAALTAMAALSTTACDAVPEVVAARSLAAPQAAAVDEDEPGQPVVPVAGKPVLWGYVDGAGMAHFASSQIDSRYTQVLRETAGRRVAGKTQGTDGLLTWLEISPDVKAMQPLLDEAARATGVDEELLKAVITVESSYNARAVSPRGAVGLMQLTPVTADRYGTKEERQRPAAERMLDARTNVLTGARMLADLTRRYGGIDIALAAWNAGEGNVRRAGGRMPEIAETEAHVHMVLELYWALLQRNLPHHARGVEVATCAPAAACGR
jgi:soluble lytic murein transglycosylase-like protein